MQQTIKKNQLDKSGKKSTKNKSHIYTDPYLGARAKIGLKKERDAQRSDFETALWRLLFYLEHRQGEESLPKTIGFIWVIKRFCTRCARDGRELAGWLALARFLI